MRGRGWKSTSAVAVGLIAACCSPAAVAAPRADRPQDEKTYELDLEWTIIHADIHPNSDLVTTTYSAEGQPFGTGHVATETHRKLEGGNTGVMRFAGANRHGTYNGSCLMTRKYLDTTPNRQVIKYTGHCSLTKGTGRYKNIHGGIPHVTGISRCTRKDCQGNLLLSGEARF